MELALFYTYYLKDELIIMFNFNSFNKFNNIYIFINSILINIELFIIKDLRYSEVLIVYNIDL